MSAMTREEIEEFRRHREWWRRPDPYDPRNAPDEPDESSPSEASAGTPATDEPPSSGQALLKENGDG